MNIIKKFFDVNFMLNKEEVSGTLPDTSSAYRRYFKIAFPSAIEGLLLDLISVIDLVMVGSLGASAIAAVGSFSQPKMMMLAICRSLSITVTAIVARRFSENNTTDMNRCLKQSLLINLILYLPMTLVALTHIPQILHLAGAPSEVMDQATEYGSLITIGIFIASFSMIFNGAQIGLGNTKIVLYSNVAGNLINTIFNFFLIYGIGFFPMLGVKGAAIATLLGYTTTTLLSFYFVLKDRNGLSLTGKNGWLPKGDMLRSISSLGMASFSEQIFERIGMFLYTAMVARIGTVALATHHVCMSLCNIFYSFAIGLGKANSSLSGQMLGYGRGDLAKLYGKIGQRCGLIIALFSCIIYLTFKTPLIQLYTDDVAVVDLGTRILILVGFCCIPQVISLVYSGVLKGAGDSLYVAKYSLIVIAIFRPILTYILCFPLGLGLYGAWISMFCDQSLRMICASFRFRGNHWQHIRV